MTLGGLARRLWDALGVKRRFPRLHRLAVDAAYFRPFEAHQWYLVAWNVHTTLVRLACRLTGRGGAFGEEFRREGLVEGRVDVSAFAASLETCPKIAFDRTDYHPDYYAYTEKGDQPQLRAAHSTYVLGPRQLDALKPVLERLAEPISRHLGTPWRVLNIRCPETKPSEIREEYYGWHTDGCPWDMLKAMVYVTPPGEQTGTMALRRRDGSEVRLSGPAGSWYLFDINGLPHRGVPPKRGARVVVEITLAPALSHDLTPVCGGSVGQFPKWPWTRIKERRTLTGK